MNGRSRGAGVTGSAAGALLAVVALPAFAQPGPAYGSAVERAGAAVIDAPFGLATVWHAGARPVRAADDFSPNGTLLGLRGASGVSVLEAGDGAVVLRAGSDPRRDPTYSLAVASDGRIAIGGTGGLALHGAPTSKAAVRYRCVDACGPVLASAFSPDGAWLAYQGTRGRRERRQGLGVVVVLDARTGEVVARLEASAARAYVAFTRDGRSLVASNTTQIDDVEVYGLREYATADWRLERHLLGTAQRWHAVGAAGDRFVAVYADRGHLEARDLDAGRTLWTAPLVAPSLDASVADTVAMRLDLVELSTDGAFVVTYESPVPKAGAASAAGTIVVRRAADGLVEAMYDVAGVTALAISPDSRAFAYSTRDGEGGTVLALLPF